MEDSDMADLPPYPDSHYDTGDDSGVGPGTSRWVYVFGFIALTVVLLFVLLMLTGGGGHGPGRHQP